MKFLSSEKLSQHKYKTSEGYLICTDAILARTGKQTYQRCEVFADAADDSTEVEIDRKPEEVFSPMTLASFENKPITIEHPEENVTANNYNDLSVGFVRDVHKGTVDGQDVMLGTLVITDAKAIEEIENGEHTDLSCGYDCDIIDEANPQQRNIRGNHVALCQQGRAGIARIVDSVKDDIVFDYTEADLDKAKEMLITAKTDDEKKLIKSLIAKIEFELKSKKLNDSIDRNKIEQIIKSRQFELRKNGDKIQEYIYKGNAEDKKYNFEELAKALPTNVSLALSGDELSIAFRDSLIQSSSKEALQENIKTEIKSGKDPKQAQAIAYSVQRQNDEDNNENEDEFIQAHSDAKAMYEEIISREAMTEEEAKRLVYKYFKGKDSIKDEQKPYAITPRRKWQSNKKLEQFFTSLEEAKYVKNASERADGIDYVVVDTRTMRIVDGKKTFTIRTEDKDNIYIAKVKANNAIEAFNKFNNKK